jgi:glycosyltransferase involved in cell wall biosynthesis
MKNQKILFLDHTAALGGAELILSDLVAAYGHNSQVLLFSDGLLRTKLESRNVTVQVIPVSEAILNLRASAGIEALTTIPKLWAIAKKVKQAAVEFDLILANSQKSLIVAALASLLGSPPVVWYLHDILTAKHFSSLNRRVAVTLANKFAAKVIVNSLATEDAFITAGGKKELIQVVYNGFNAEPFETIAPEAVTKIRHQLGITEATVVGLFSRLSYWKGQHILLSAIKELPQVHALLVGDALFGEEEYVSKIKALAEEAELKNRVHWLGFRDDVPLLMKTCDIVVHTSTEPEPFGRVIVEGQLAQRPVIASGAGGALELIEDGVSGLLFPPGDAIALRNAIQKLEGDRNFAQQIAQQGYTSAKNKFALETILQSFQEALSTI